MLSNKILKKAILCSSITLYIAIGIQYLVLYPDTNVVKNSCVVLVEILAAAMTIYIQASYGMLNIKADQHMNIIGEGLSLFILFLIFLPELVFKIFTNRILICILLVLIFLTHLYVVIKQNKSLKGSENSVYEEVCRKDEIEKLARKNPEYIVLNQLLKTSNVIGLLYLIIELKNISYILIIALGVIGAIILKTHEKVNIPYRNIIIIYGLIASIISAILLYYGVKIISWIMFMSINIVIKECRTKYLYVFYDEVILENQDCFDEKYSIGRRSQ